MIEAVVDRFLTKSPLTVMVRLVLDRACDPVWVDQVFAEQAEGQPGRVHTISLGASLRSVIVERSTRRRVLSRELDQRHRVSGDPCGRAVCSGTRAREVTPRLCVRSRCPRCVAASFAL